jgi:hypothetical protein
MITSSIPLSVTFPKATNTFPVEEPMPRIVLDEVAVGAVEAHSDSGFVVDSKDSKEEFRANGNGSVLLKFGLLAIANYTVSRVIEINEAGRESLNTTTMSVNGQG